MSSAPASASRPLRVLVLEHAASDPQSLLDELRRGGFAPFWRRVETAPELVAALASDRWDVILCACSLPEIDAAAALRVFQQTEVDIPFIVVSGTPGEELAVQMMRAGASDYVLRHNLKRLVPAIERELRESECRRKRHQAEEAVRQLAAIVQSSTDAIISETLDGIVTSWNAAAERLFGWMAHDAVGRNISFIVPADRAGELATVMAQLRDGGRVEPFETVRLHRSGDRLDVVVTLSPVCDETGRLVGISKSARDIRDEKKRSENLTRRYAEALKLSEERYRLLVDTIPHMVWMADADGRTDYLNPRGAERAGVPPASVSGWNWLQSLHADDVDRSRQRWENAVRTGTSYVNEYRVRQPNGTYRWYLAQGVPLRGRNGQVQRWVGTWTDIDDLKRAEERLARDSLLLANVHDSVVVTDLNGLVTYWNEGATRVFGWTAEEMVGRPLLNRFPEHARPALTELTRTIQDGKELSGEFEGYHKDGSRIWVDTQVSRITDAAGQSIGFMGVSHDITVRKRTEAERDRLFEQLRGHVERLPLAYLSMDSDLRIVDWNSAAERIFGYTKEEVLGMGPPYEKILPPFAWQPAERVLARLRAGDMAAHVINENVTKDGRTITCEWYTTPLLDADGAFLGFVSLAQDISDRRRAEDALRVSDERFRQIAESISEVFWLTTPDRHEIVYASPGYETLWGRPLESAYTSESWMEAIHPDDRGRVTRAALTKQAAGEYDEEYRIIRPDGTIRWIRDRAFPVRDANGTVVRVAGVAEDITGRRHLEEQLRQAQKMEAVGQLAGGVAHDFNNLLTVITGYSELLADALHDDKASRDLVDEIRKAGERSAALTRQLLAFSRKQVLAPRIIDVNEIVCDTEKMLRRVIGEDVDLTTALHPGIGSVRADSGQLEQVLLNLSVNARDAMPEGGKLTIETRNVEIDEDYAAQHPGVAPGPYVMLAVTDSGTGMTEEVKRHLFEPFFTTKGPGKGTGLGLAVVHGFVKQSEGHVAVYSEPGVGTSFKVYLPRVDSRGSSAARRASPTSALARGTETILLVEDEDGVRALTTRVLQGCGYTVLEASRGEEALRIARKQQKRIHLLLTDVVMPGLGGRALADQLRSLYPALKVLYVSGYTSDAVVRHGILHEHVDFLQKPFSPAALARKVREALTK